jgi:acyl carrier protein
LKHIEKLNSENSIKGIVHCAGVLEDSLLENLEWSSIENVFASKVKGTLHLNSIIEKLHLKLNHFICFSSVSSVLGVASQANYGMANRLMDALMRERAQGGQSGLSINWGPWSEVGMASLLSEKEINFWKQRGLDYLSVEACKGLLQNIFKSSSYSGQIIACQIDWQKFLPFNNSRVFSNFEQKAIISISGDILKEIANAPMSDRLELITNHISREVATVLGIKNFQEIDLKKGLMELGLDSLAAVDLKSRLELSLKVTLKATLAFDYPTLEGLINHIAYKVLNIGEVSAPKIASESDVSSSDNEDIAAALARELESLGDDS